MKFKLHASSNLENTDGHLVVKGLLDPTLRRVKCEEEKKEEEVRMCMRLNVFASCVFCWRIGMAYGVC